MIPVFRHSLAAALLVSLAPPGHAQLFKLTREQLVEITADNPFERFPDGRPRIPDHLIERAKGLSAEEVLGGAPRQGLQVPVGGRLPDPPSRPEARGPRLHRPVHARAPRHHGRPHRQRRQGGRRALHPPVRDRPAPARRRVRGRHVREEGRRNDRRRQPLLLHHEGDPIRRPRRRRLGARPRRPRAIQDAGLLPPRAPDGDPRRDAHGHQRPDPHRRGHRQYPATSSSATARASTSSRHRWSRRSSTRPTSRTSTTSGRRRSSTKASTSRARSTAPRATRP